jgi:hypothetical protein
MGFFGTYALHDGEWAVGAPAHEPYLAVDIHDSDVATVDYRPAVSAAGRFYLGYQPRVYFEDETASAPVDNAAEARGFVRWVREVRGEEVAADDVERLMAPADEDAEPEDVFVEDTVVALLELAGLPPIEDLPVLDLDGAGSADGAGTAGGPHDPAEE